MTSSRKFGSSVFWMAAGNWIEYAVNFAVYVALARLLGASEFGLAAMAASFVILGEALVRQTLTEWLVAAHDPEPEHYSAVFISLAVLSLALYGLLILCSGLLADLYDAEEVDHLIRYLGIVIPLTGLTGVPVAKLRRAMRFDVLGFRAALGAVLGGVAGLGLAISGGGVWAIVVHRVVLVATNETVAWIAAGWRPSFRTTWRHARDVLGLGFGTFWLQAGQLVSVQSATVIFGATLGPQATGFFSLAWRLTEIVTALVNVPVALVAQPAFAAARHSGANVRKFLEDIHRVTTLVALGVFCGIAVLAEPFLGLVFGDEWIEAADILRILCVLGVYLSVESIQQSFCLSAGKARGYAIITTFEALFGIVAMIMVAPMGGVAIAGVFVGRYLLFWPLRFFFVKSIGGIGLVSFSGVFLPGAIAAGAMVAAMFAANYALGLDVRQLGGFLVAVVVGGIAFTAYVLLLLPGRVRTARQLLGRGEETSVAGDANG